MLPDLSTVDGTDGFKREMWEKLNDRDFHYIIFSPTRHPVHTGE